MREIDGKYYLGNTQTSIMREREMYSRKLGIGIHSPTSLEHIDGVPNTDTNDPLWLPRETQTAYSMLEQSKAILVAGGPGSGKSTIIYGVRKLLREQDVPYCYYNGHFRSTNPSHIESAMSWTQRVGGVFVWDSFDYLVSTRDRNRRNISRGMTMQRSNALFNSVQTHIDSGMRFIGTCHDEAWMNNKTEDEVMDTYWRPFTMDKPIVEVKGEFADTDELHAFYECVGPSSGLSDEDRVYFANLPTVVDDALAQDLRSYRIAKQICMDRRQEHDDLMKAYRLLKVGGIEHEQFDFAIRRYVAIKNEQTQNLIKNK
jgi:hypothetical protein